MSRIKKSKTTLSCFLAREASVGVILRRGSTKQVLLIRWHMKNDTFETGQWFKRGVFMRTGAIYPLLAINLLILLLTDLDGNR